jgi:hypothetical protein
VRLLRAVDFVLNLFGLSLVCHGGPLKK